MASVLKEIYEMQINSLKIEGRMRSIYYISTIVNTYKRILEDISMNNLTDKRIEYYTYILNRCANRESTVQFFSKQPGVNEQYYTGREEKTNKDFLGVVIEYNKETKEALIEQRNYFSVGDEIEVFSPIDEPYSFTVQSIKTLDGDNVSAARHPKEKLYIKIEKEVKQNDIIRVKMTP